MTLATAHKDTVTQLWMVQIRPCLAQGIRGGKMGPWRTRHAAQKYAASFNALHTPGFKAGDEVKFYVGDDLSITYGVVVSASEKSCRVRVNGYEQDLTYTVEKEKLNHN